MDRKHTGEGLCGEPSTNVPQGSAQPHTPDTRDAWEHHVEDVKGHTLKRDEDGLIDSFVTDFGLHNGPGCIVCDETWCQHCTSAEEVEPCPGGDEKRARDEAEAADKRLRDAAPDLLEALEGLLAITSDSAGVAGYHLNGAVAEWGEFPEVAVARSAISRARGE